MGRFFLGLLIVIGSILMLKYRKQVTDIIGDHSWMMKVGGGQNFVALVGVALCLWGFLMMFNMTDFFIGMFLSPFKMFGG